MKQKTFTCAEEELAAQLQSIGAACHHFGWKKPRDHIFKARDALLEARASAQPETDDAPC